MFKGVGHESYCSKLIFIFICANVDVLIGERWFDGNPIVHPVIRPIVLRDFPALPPARRLFSKLDYWFLILMVCDDFLISTFSI